ncbi:hepatocellular carcinoma-associated antigen 59-domain-containing protein [Trametes punicea]|nr:hepatocellular carcinoma-associated antigen 59-domain-containing protein [Trametes punicea]
MIRKRSRPQPRIRQLSIEREEEEFYPAEISQEQAEEKLDIADLIELRKLRKSREGIDVAKLSKGDLKKKRKRPKEEEVVAGLRPGASVDHDDNEGEDTDAKTRKVVRTNNFTQQTNTLDVDKHMMAYIEENMKLRRGAKDEPKKEEGQTDPLAEVLRITEKYKQPTQKKEQEEGSVTNSLAMLTAIPEVDLGMDARLKNIEETEKAKRMLAEQRKERQRKLDDEAHLAAARFYRPNLKAKSDADILRDAKLEAMGLNPEDHDVHRPLERPQMATDEIVMERFKKRMRK